jgi:alpha-mannosidase
MVPSKLESWRYKSARESTLQLWIFRPWAGSALIRIDPQRVPVQTWLLPSSFFDNGDCGLPVVLETDVLRIAFNEHGEILSMYDKEAGRELAAAPMNRLRLYADVPSSCDAWDIESSCELLPLPLDGPAEMELAASGPLVWKLKIRRHIGSSTLTQEIVVRQHDRRVDFHTVVDWHERHKLLKVCFPTTVQSDEASV